MSDDVRWIGLRVKDGRRDVKDGRRGWCGHRHRSYRTAKECVRTAFPRGGEWGTWIVYRLDPGESPWLVVAS